MSTEIVPASPRPSYEGLTLVVSPTEAAKRVQELQAFVQAAMVKDVDFGTIPGTPKPTLYQPGAQKLAEIYGFAHHFEVLDSLKDWERSLFYFEYRCVLTSRRDDSHVGEGIGSANSRESKYAWRWVDEAQLPPGLDKATLQRQSRQKWVFDNEIPAGVDRAKLPREQRISRKTGNPYMVYGLGGVSYRVPNPDIADAVNTLQKMACKRAYVHAVIAATRSSGLFTQDLEDLPPEAFGQASPARSWDVEEPAAQPAVAPAAPAPPQDAPAVLTGIAERVERLRAPTESQLRLEAGFVERIDASETMAELSRVLTAIGTARELLHPHGILNLRALAKVAQSRLKPGERATPPPPDKSEEREPGID